MSAAGSRSKRMKVVVNLSSSEEDIVEHDVDDEGESDSWLGHEDEEDDDGSEWEEENSESEEEYEDEESESDQEEYMDSDESIDEDEKYESISEDQSNEDDDNNVCDRKQGKPTDSGLSGKVISLLRQRNKKLDGLKLEECKAYLRKHELMISGTKAVCIQRILEHWRLKDVNGERLYPKSSFTINCTGDVCKGDVVMFKQRVYEKFDKVSRSGKVIGKRTIAGRIVKENYGVAKQQHTFTVEVLWSKGVKPLPPLYTLLVKGRNLYRYKTFRQCWRNEAERFKVLEEKHRRGARARHVRASNQTRNYAGSMRKRKPSESRKHPNKRLKKVSKATTSEKRKQSFDSKTRVISSGKKLAATASSSRHVKKHGAKASSVAQSKKSKFKATSRTHPRLVNPHENEADPLHDSARKPTFRNTYDRSYTHLHQRNNVAAYPKTGREMFHMPSYNHEQNAGHAVALMRQPHHHQLRNDGTNYMIRPYAGHASQFDPGRHLGPSHSAYVSQYSSRSSGHFFTPAIHDYNFPWR